MNKYRIEYAEIAEKDIDNLFNTIVNDYKSPITAFKYTEGLIDAINHLSDTGDIYSNCTSFSVETFGSNIKRRNYKKMAIFYSVYDDFVWEYSEKCVSLNSLRQI